VVHGHQARTVVLVAVVAQGCVLITRLPVAVVVDTPVVVVVLVVLVLVAAVDASSQALLFQNPSITEWVL
jgi:hypothetical protein